LNFEPSQAKQKNKNKSKKEGATTTAEINIINLASQRHLHFSLSNTLFSSPLSILLYRFSPSRILLRT